MFTESAQLPFMYIINYRFVLLISALSQKNTKRSDVFVFAIQGLQDIWNDQDLFGIKRMGEVDEKPFKGVCLKKFPNDWEVNAAELISLWQANVSNPIWHPFKTEFLDGKLQVLFFTFFLLLLSYSLKFNMDT